MPYPLRLILIVTFLSPLCSAQPLQPVGEVGFRTHVFPNPTSAGSPSIATKIWYPSATTSGPSAPLPVPPAGGFPVVVVLHGRCSTADRYVHLSWGLAAQGFIVVGEDSSGCGEDLQRDDAIALYHAFSIENLDPASFLYQALDMDGVGIVGHSMGAGNVGRVLAGNPGYRAGVALGIWNGWPGANWQLTAAPQISDPMMLVHGIADSSSTYTGTALAWFNLLPDPREIHVLHVFDANATHFNVAMPGYPTTSYGIDMTIFVRSLEVITSFFRRYLDEHSRSLEYVVGDSARTATYVYDILTKVRRPQLWSDREPATGQTHCLNVLSKPGFASIYVAPAPFLMPTPIGDLLIDPLTAVPLIAGTPNSSDLLSICLNLPPDPILIGGWFIHQALGTSDSGAIMLSNAVEFTIEQ